MTLTGRLGPFTPALMVLALAGCAATTPAGGGGATTTEARPAPDRGEARQAAEEGPDLEYGWAVLHYDALVRRADAALDAPDDTGARRDHVEWGLARGERLELYFLVTRGIAPASRRPRDELLVVIEGKGLLEVSGRTREVGPGTLCALPAGARGALEASTPGSPLYALLVRARGAPAPGARPWFGDIVDVPLVPASRAVGPRVTRVAGTPGLGLHALALAPGTSWGAEGFEHDVAIFVLDGMGNLGVANAGGRALQGSVAIVPAGVSWYFMTSTDESVSALVFAAPEVPELVPTVAQPPR